ncbi:hypothetical protein [Salipiger mucosus]|nr:hypothetical protein [Salipiger mucosus]
MTIDQIESIIRRDHGGAWWALFHQTTHGHRFLPTGDVLTARAYDEIRRRFGAQMAETGAEELTPEDRKRNRVRAKAHAADGGRYGR